MRTKKGSKWYIKNHDIKIEREMFGLDYSKAKVTKELILSEIQNRAEGHAIDYLEDNLDIDIDDKIKDTDEVIALLKKGELNDEMVDVLEMAAKRAALVGVDTVVGNIRFVNKFIDNDASVEVKRQLGTENIVNVHPGTDAGKEQIKQIVENAEKRLDEINKQRGSRHSKATWNALADELRKIEEISQKINEGFDTEFDEIVDRKRELESDELVPGGFTKKKVSQKLRGEFPDTLPLYQKPIEARENINEVKKELNGLHYRIAVEEGIENAYNEYSDDVSKLSQEHLGDKMFQSMLLKNEDQLDAAEVENKWREVILDVDRNYLLGDVVDNLENIPEEYNLKQLEKRRNNLRETESSNDDLEEEFANAGVKKRGKNSDSTDSEEERATEANSASTRSDETNDNKEHADRNTESFNLVDPEDYVNKDENKDSYSRSL